MRASARLPAYISIYQPIQATLDAKERKRVRERARGRARDDEAKEGRWIRGETNGINPTN